jgi:hypothetical protein
MTWGQLVAASESVMELTVSKIVLGLIGLAGTMLTLVVPKMTKRQKIASD